MPDRTVVSVMNLGEGMGAFFQDAAIIRNRLGGYDSASA
jgi:hypothetical protein